MNSTIESVPRGLACIVLGVLSSFCLHYGVFIHGEWHTKAPAIVLGHTVPFVVLLIVGSSHDRDSMTGVAASALLSVGLWYLVSLTMSIVIYRVFFHRLTRAGFKGPWYARVSKIWHVWEARKSQNYLYLARLHEEYGDFVRTGK